MSGIKKNIVFIVMILIVLVVGLVWYSSYNEPSVTVDESFADDARDAERDSEYEALRIQILANIATIKAISLNTTILQNPAFLVLERPERQAAGPLDPGRPNPFLPY